MNIPTRYKSAEMGAIGGAVLSAVSDVSLTDGIVIGAACAYAGAALTEFIYGAVTEIQKRTREEAQQERKKESLDTIL